VARAKRSRPQQVPEIVRDERDRVEGRFRIYKLLPGRKRGVGLVVPGGLLVHIASTPSGVEETLIKLREEGQITHNSIVGIKDDVDRRWLINPLGKGDKR